MYAIHCHAQPCTVILGIDCHVLPYQPRTALSSGLGHFLASDVINHETMYNQLGHALILAISLQKITMGIHCPDKLPNHSLTLAIHCHVRGFWPFIAMHNILAKHCTAL